MSKLAEELAKSITPCPCCTGDYSGVIAAIVTAMQEVRKRDAEVCARLVDVENMPGCYRHPDNIECAAAIAKELLP